MENVLRVIVKILLKLIHENYNTEFALKKIVYVSLKLFSPKWVW